MSSLTFFSSSKRRFHLVQSLDKQRPGQHRQSSFAKALVVVMTAMLLVATMMTMLLMTMFI